MRILTQISKESFRLYSCQEYCQYNHRICKCTLTSLPSFQLGKTNTLLFHVLFRNCYFKFVLVPTYSMEQSPSWEANLLSASQEIPRILWNPKVHYRIHKYPPPVPILSQSMLPYPTSWRSSLILSSLLRLGLPSGLFLSGFPSKTLYTPFLSQIYATCPAHAILLKFLLYISPTVIRLYGIISYVAVI